MRDIPKGTSPDTARFLISEIPEAWKKNRDWGGRPWRSGVLADHCNLSSSYVSRILAELYKAGLEIVNGIPLPYNPRRKNKSNKKSN